LAFCKNRTVIEIFEKAGGNSNGGQTGHMVKKEITQFKIGVIYLIANEIEPAVCQEFFAGIPGIAATGTFFKY
jgi:hypothetical protein